MTPGTELLNCTEVIPYKFSKMSMIYAL